MPAVSTPSNGTASDGLSGLLGRIVDTAGGILVARNTPAAPAPTDAPRIPVQPAGLPAANAPGVAPFWPFPPVVWVILSAGLVGGFVYAMRRK